MYPVSELYLSRIQERSIQCTWYGTITTKTGKIYNLDDKWIALDRSEFAHEICTNDYIEIGTACIASLRLYVYITSVTDLYDHTTYYINGKTVDRYELYDAEIKLTFRLFFEDGTYEDVPLKTFVVSDPVRSIDMLQLTAYDYMKKFDSTDITTLTDATAYDFLSLACASCRVQLGMTSQEIAALPNGDIKTYISPNTNDLVTTWRDMISFIAQMLGCYAYIGYDDKLYLKQYSMSQDRVIGSDQRFSADIADYETYYTSIVSTYKEDKTVSGAFSEPDDGLQYDMGINPFLQFPLQQYRDAAIENIFFSYLSTLRYTPASISCPVDPSIECGDIIEITENHGVFLKYTCITSINYTLSGVMTIDGTGRDPHLVTLESKLVKLVKGESSDIDSASMKYYDFVNAERIVIGDGEHKQIIKFNYIATRDTHIDFHAQVKLYADTTETLIDEDTWDENSANLKITYYINGKELTQYYPLEEYFDGYHMLTLIYAFFASSISNGTFIVDLEVQGATIIIEQYDSRSYIAGVGLMGEDAWNGRIDIFEDFDAIGLEDNIGLQSDSVDVHTVEDIKAANINEVIVINPARFLGSLTETLSATSNIMVIRPGINTDYYSTNCTVSDNAWIGSGYIQQGSAAFVVTGSIYGVDHVVLTRSIGAVFLVEFDNSGHWQGYSTDTNTWQDDVAMTSIQLTSLTASQWAQGGTVVKIKALIETDCSLQVINIYGGRINNA